MLCETCIVTEKVPLGIVGYVWENTCEGSVLRGLLVDLVSFWLRDGVKSSMISGSMGEVLWKVVMLRQ